MKRNLFLLVLALCLSAPVHAIDKTPDPLESGNENESSVDFDYDDSQDKIWKEGETKLPPLPADDRLLAVEMDGLPHGLKLYLDAEDLSLNEADEVLRFWVVIKSPAGAYNATYEGLRCETAEFKVYAYGRRHSSPNVRPVPKPEWRDIGSLPGDHFRRELAQDLLCMDVTPRSQRDIIQRIKYWRKDASDSTDISSDY